MNPITDRQTIYVELYSGDGPEPPTAETILLPRPAKQPSDRNTILLAMIKAKKLFEERQGGRPRRVTS